MTTKTPARRRPAMLGGVQPFPPALAKRLPAPVKQASAEFAAALAAHAEAGAAAMEARRHAEAAPREDERLAAEAEAAGKPIPEAIAPAARADLLQAERRVGATERIATDHQNAFLAALVDHHAELVAAFREDREAEAAKFAALLGQLEGAALALRTQDHVLAELGADSGHLTGRVVHFSPREMAKLGKAAEPIEALRGQIG